MHNTDAYSRYLAATASGWELLEAFAARHGSLSAATIAHHDGISQAQAKRFQLTFARIKPCRALAAQLSHSLDVLHLISGTIIKVSPRHNDLRAFLDKMLRACHLKSVADAEHILREILATAKKPTRPARVNRINFAHKPDDNNMVRFLGKLRAEDARRIQEKFQAAIRAALRENESLTGDVAMANLMVNAILRGETTNASAPEHEYSPAVVMSVDPNVDLERGVINTASGASIPLEDAINYHLRNTGWVLGVSQTGSKAKLEFIAPIINTRFSTGTHRLGVMLETLMCARCDTPAIFCHAHHIEAWAHSRRPRDWEDLTNLCPVDNSLNDDNPNAPPRNGRVERDEKGWPGWKYSPDGRFHYNPNPVFRHGWRGTIADILANQA